MPVLLLCHLHAEPESRYFPCNLKNQCLHTTLLKQIVNKACPEDKAVPLVCLCPLHHASGAEVILVVHESHLGLDVSSPTCAAGSSLKFVTWQILVWTRYLLAGGIFRRFCRSEGKRHLDWSHCCTRDVTKPIALNPSICYLSKNTPYIRNPQV